MLLKSDASTWFWLLLNLIIFCIKSGSCLFTEIIFTWTFASSSTFFELPIAPVVCAPLTIEIPLIDICESSIVKECVRIVIPLL